MPRVRLKCLLLLSLLLTLLGCRAASTPALTVAPWRTSTPEEQGMDSAQLAAMLEAVEARRLDLDSVLVIRNGAVVLEAYYPPYSQDTNHELFPVRLDRRVRAACSALRLVALDRLSLLACAPQGCIMSRTLQLVRRFRLALDARSQGHVSDDPEELSGGCGGSPMANTDSKPHIFRILHEEASEVRSSPFGSVGELFSGEGLEAVWVRKENEEIDPGWFSQPMVDLLLVVQGRLRVEFEQSHLSPCVLEPGDLLVLPPSTRCRAYRWPRDAEEATVFLAVYPTA